MRQLIGLQIRSLEWCPPGHGDIYPSLLGSGLLDELLSGEKEFLVRLKF